MLEILEDRWVPATYTWTDVAVLNSNVSDADNWQDENQMPGVPGPQDTIRYVGQHNRPSVVDVPFTVTEIQILDGYTSTITLKNQLTSTTTTQQDGVLASFGSYMGRFVVPAQGTYNWEGGTIKGMAEGGDPMSEFVIQNLATMNIRGAGNKIVHDEAIKNYGTINWTGSGDITFQDDGEIQNLYGGRFNISNNDDDAEMLNSGGNSGLLYVDSTSRINLTTNHDADIDVDFTNQGRVDVQTGRVYTTGLSLFTGGQITGQGQFMAYVLEVRGSVQASVDNLTIFTLQGGGIFDFTGSFWGIGGSSELRGSGMTRIGNNAHVRLYDGGLRVFDNHTVENFGLVTMESINPQVAVTLTFVDGVFNNRPGGVFEVKSQGPTTIQDDPNIGNGGFFSNEGTFKKTTHDNGTTVSTTFSQSGTLDAQIGEMAFTENISQHAGQTLMNGGNLRFEGEFMIHMGSSLTTDISRYDLLAAPTIFAQTVVNFGTINFTGTTTLGTMGRLHIEDSTANGTGGHYTQMQLGRLNLRISGEDSADQLDIAGTATLGGVLEVDLFNYAPQGQTPLAWTLLTFNTRLGTFMQTSVPPGFSVGYGATSVSTTWTP